MVDSIKSWFSVVHVIWLLVVGFAGMLAYIVNWKSDMEARLGTLETRGSPHLEEINRRLTVTEKETESNKASLALIREVLTRELGKSPPAR